MSYLRMTLFLLNHLSVMAAVTWRAKLFTWNREEPFTGIHGIRFLKRLLRLMPRKLW
jgi:hypothetical protein